MSSVNRSNYFRSVRNRSYINSVAENYTYKYTLLHTPQTPNAQEQLILLSLQQ